jgi:FeS assembly SUF system protein
MEQTLVAEPNIAAEPAANQDTLRDQVLDAIKTVYDPEIPVDIYELGLIYELTVYPVNNVFVLMTLTSPACPSAEQIPEEVKQKVSAVPGVNEVTVEITWNPPYSQEMMSEVAKLELGFL